jgi:hypothetical protein
MLAVKIGSSDEQEQKMTAINGSRKYARIGIAASTLPQNLIAYL